MRAAFLRWWASAGFDTWDTVALTGVALAFLAAILIGALFGFDVALAGGHASGCR